MLGRLNEMEVRKVKTKTERIKKFFSLSNINTRLREWNFGGKKKIIGKFDLKNPGPPETHEVRALSRVF